MASALLNVMQYNPMQANTVDRINYIAFHTCKFDVVILIGTKVQHGKHLKDDFASRRTECGSTVLDAGYGKGRYTNNHAGISFVINNRVLQTSNLTEKGVLVGEARGRAAYVRFKARGGDFAFIGAYYPPKPNKSKEVPRYLKACELITDWIADTIHSLPAGCTPFIAVDLNDGIGRAKIGKSYAYTQTEVIMQHASRIEKHEDGAGALFRRLCELQGLVVHTANHDDRCTWFSGDGRASSLIDYIAAPGDLAVRKAGQLAGLGSVLQHVEVNRRVDHMPTFICFYIGEDKARYRSPPTQRWNYDSMMKCLKDGTQRRELVMEVEKCCETFFERHPDLLLQHTPDDLNDTLMQELVSIAQRYFHQDNKGRNQCYEDAKKLREEMLKNRGALRKSLQDDPHLSPEKLAQVQADLATITKLLHKSRQSQWHDTQEHLTQDIHEAWRKRDMKSAYSLMRRLAGSKFDVKKRDWRLVQQALPTRADWEEVLSKVGNQGGMSARTCTWAEMRQEHVALAAEEPLPPSDLNHIQRAKQEVKDLTKYVLFANKRKAVPPNTLPTEILVALLAPNYIKNKQTPGLHSKHDAPLSEATTTIKERTIQFVSGPLWPSDTGRPDFHESSYKPPKLHNPHTKQAFIKLHAHIERTRQTPLTWHRSKGAAIPKYNGKKGAMGSRLVHVLDPMGKAFYTKKHKATKFTHNDTGFAPHRRREYAVLCQNCTNFKLTRAKRNFINNNHDCTNAFCCTGLDECDQICSEKLFEPEDVDLGQQRHRYSSCVVQSREDRHDPDHPLFIRPQQGNLQGDNQGVKTFPLAFEQPVSRWLLHHLQVYLSLSGNAYRENEDGSAPQEVLREYNFCLARCPQTGESVDTAHTKYADDIVKTILGPPPSPLLHGHRAHQEALECLVRRAEASSILLSKCLEEEKYAQNESKLIGVIGLNGQGAHQHLRTLQRTAHFSCTITDHTRSLGSIVNARGTFQHERTARLDAVSKARFMLGKRITLKRMPWKLKRTLLIGQVLNVALSGVEAYALQQGDYDALQTAVTKIFRRAMGKKAVQLK